MTANTLKKMFAKRILILPFETSLSGVLNH